MSLVDSLVFKGYLKTPQIQKAFQKIKRIDFLPEEFKYLAEVDEALPIGRGQTISQPSVVAFMIELLQPKEGDKILDVGSGSGWTTALLASIVGEKGRVIGVELIPELKEFGERNVAKYNFIEKGIVEFICADGSQGYKTAAPYDKILVSAAAQERVPIALKEQLKQQGRIVIPIGNSIYLLIKKEYDFKNQRYRFEKHEYPGFVFVPLIEAK
ncbi:protein-L-isoaspartate O-methyltransferase [bacterium]|nr:protein-L-isoaspartate O-methyltransferase [bacterium]